MFRISGSGLVFEDVQSFEHLQYLENFENQKMKKAKRLRMFKILAGRSEDYEFGLSKLQIYRLRRQTDSWREGAHRSAEKF